MVEDEEPLDPLEPHLHLEQVVVLDAVREERGRLEHRESRHGCRPVYAGRRTRTARNSSRRPSRRGRPQRDPGASPGGAPRSPRGRERRGAGRSARSARRRPSPPSPRRRPCRRRRGAADGRASRTTATRPCPGPRAPCRSVPRTYGSGFSSSLRAYARPAGPVAPRVPGLDDEVGDDAVDRRAVEETLPRERDEALDGHRGLAREELGLERAPRRRDRRDEATASRPSCARRR